MTEASGSSARAAGTSRGTLEGRSLYIPRMSVEGASVFAAAFRAYGVNGQLVPEGDAKSIELARQYTIGEECYPEIVTLGAFLKIIEDRNFDPEKTAFFIPTANGPCRFGQYRHILQEVLAQKGLGEVMVVSPTSANGYEGVGEHAGELARLGWWALVAADSLRKLLLQTRPYERNAGETDRVHSESLDALCGVIERDDVQLKGKFDAIVDVVDQIGLVHLVPPSVELMELESQRESGAALSVSMTFRWSAEDDLQAY